MLVAQALGQSAWGDEVLVIRGVRVLPMDGTEDGGVREAQTVVIADGRVRAMGPAGEVVVPPRAHVVDGAGRTLLPGLIDAHVRVEDGYELVQYLAHGVTTVRCFGAEPFHLRLRAEVESGALVGPTLVLAADLSRARRVKLEARLLAVRTAGYDFVHLDRDLDADEWLAAARMAGAGGLAVAGTLAPRANLGEALESTAWTIESAESLLGPFLQSELRGGRPFAASLRLARRSERIESIARAGRTLVPLLTAFDALLPPIDKVTRQQLLGDPRVHSVSPLAYGKWAPAGHDFRRTFRKRHLPALEAAAPVLRDLVRALHSAGLPIAAGSGAMTPFVYPGESLWDELDALVACGMRPLEALRAATRVAADAVGRPELGRVVVGARADLLLVEGDPAASLAALRRPVGVVFGGRYFSCESLRELAREHERTFRRELPFLRALGERGTEFAVAEHSGADGRPPLRPFTWSRACTLLVESKRWRDALVLAETAVEHYPGAAWPHLAVAEALLSGGDRDAALAAWRRARDIDRTSGEVRRVRSLFGAPPARKQPRPPPRGGGGAGLSPGRELPPESRATRVRGRERVVGGGYAASVFAGGSLSSASGAGEVGLTSASERFRVCGCIAPGAPVSARPAVAAGRLPVGTRRELVAFGGGPR